jgi:general secretion pathway protein E
MNTDTLARPGAKSTSERPGLPRLSVPDPEALLRALSERGVVAPDAAQRALSLHREAGVHPLPGLLRLNAVAEAPLYAAMAALTDLPLLGDDEDAGTLGPRAAAATQRLGLTAAWLKLKHLLVYEHAGQWLVGFKEPPSDEAIALLARRLAARGVAGRWCVIAPSRYERALAAMAAGAAATAPLAMDTDLRTLRELAEEGPTIELVNGILSQGVTARASDIHFEAEEFDFVVRLRVDGDLIELATYPRERYDAVACRLKILAQLDIAERRLAQDGRINARVNGEAFDIRVSVLPATHGESVVLRLLRQERKPTQLQDLGMTQAQAAKLTQWAALQNGIVLVTGPTGSGKSTTLYTTLELANDRSRKIVTVEDPVEYKLRGITQLQVNADIGFTFAAALRSILRHDPDLILVGEIRDVETAQIAIQAALTGHLVLSTLHTNSAIGAVTRLVDMGVEPFLIGASVRGLMAQRLVRRLCTHCKVPAGALDEATAATLERHGMPRTRVMQPIGCPHCSGTGFRGRLAVYDLFDLTPEMAHAIATGATEAQLLAMSTSANPGQQPGLMASGAHWVAEGETTLGEVIRGAGAPG